jgi:hypothetical protein
LAAGQTSAVVQVDIWPDLVNEGNETFKLVLSNPVNAVLGDSQGLGTVIDDDGPTSSQRRLTIADVAVVEGDAGVRVARVTVSLNRNWDTGQVRVSYSTFDGSAAYPDYTPMTGTLVFNPGETSKTVSVKVWGDTVAEPGNEWFQVVLASPIGAKIFDGIGIVTIQDDD